MSETLQLQSEELRQVHVECSFSATRSETSEEASISGKKTELSDTHKFPGYEGSPFQGLSFFFQGKKKTGGKTNQKKAKTRKASENEDVCIYYTEGVTGRSEIWLQCAVSQVGSRVTFQWCWER